MSIELRIRSTVDQTLQTLLGEVASHVADERVAAAAAARESAFAEAEQATLARVADAEAHVLTSMRETLDAARARDRDEANRDVRAQVEAEAAVKMAAAISAAEAQMKLAVATVDARAADALQGAVAEARAREREADLAGLARLLESVRGLDGAASQGEVLDALALAAAREAARAAVFVLRGDRIQGWKTLGFGLRDAQPKLVDLALADAGVIGLAVVAARTTTTGGGQTGAASLTFEVLPADRTGLAVPVVVSGRVVAVVYADAVTTEGLERAVPSGWPEVIEVLSRHAARCIEALSATRGTTPKPRIETPAVTTGASGGDAPLPGNAT